MQSVLTIDSLQCFASTTIDEYVKLFEKDKALARRFQPVLINEPSQVIFYFILIVSHMVSLHANF